MTLATITYCYSLGDSGLPVWSVTATDTGEADKPQRGGMDAGMADVQVAVGAPTYLKGMIEQLSATPNGQMNITAESIQHHC